MGLEVAEIAELAALRPIQTTAVSRPLASAGDADAHHDAADTGCVTPTAGATAVAAEEVEDGAAVDGIGSASYATPMPCRTATPLHGCEFEAVADAAAGDGVNFTTPTSDESALRPATVCPPAPRKLPPALKRKLAPLQQRLFYPVPLDLASVFKPAPPAPAPPAAKKMRAHVVEPSLPLGT